MSHFYGLIQGNRGAATRCGDARGYIAWIQGWRGNIGVRLHNTDGKDWFDVVLIGGPSSTERGSRLKLVSGPLDYDKVFSEVAEFEQNRAYLPHANSLIHLNQQLIEPYRLFLAKQFMERKE